MSYWFLLLPILLLVVDDVTSDDCGRPKLLPVNLINHGGQTNLGEWPWHIAIMQGKDSFEEEYRCGGSIISSRYILTAAHCFYQKTPERKLEPSEILIRAGISNIRQQEKKSLQQVAVTDIIIHEGYKKDTTECDIALLKLDGKLNFTNYVKPICLWKDHADEELIVGKLGHVVGWGKNEFGELQDQLQHTVMPIVSREDCKESDPDHYTIFLFDRKAFCAGFRNGTSPGGGDSGGGLYLKIGSRWMLRGIVSNGKRNETSLQLNTYEYFVFTDIAYFLSWINKKIAEGDCGQRTARLSPVYRENEARLGEWPWHAAVMHDTVGQLYPIYACGGTIIASSYILTAAHCLYKLNDKRPLDPLDVYIQAGITNLQELEHSVQQISVAEMIIFDDFYTSPLRNDIALLKLDEKLVFTDYVKPICLWKTREEQKLVAKNLGYIPGWRRNKQSYASNQLQSTVMFFVPRNQCKARYPDSYTKKKPSEDKVFCAGFYSGTSPALGLAGGGLYINHEGRWILQGILSSGPVDLYTGSFNMLSYLVFTDVTRFLPWIEENTVIINDRRQDYYRLKVTAPMK